MRLNRVLSAAAVGLALTAQAEASPITYAFSVTAISGPLKGVTENGTFTYDSSSTIPNGFNGKTGLLTELDFTWNGIHYDQVTANTGSLTFDETGMLVNEAFGNNCFAGGCLINPDTNEWFAGVGNLAFFYDTASGGFGRGNVAQALVPAPEPSTLALLGAGLAFAAIARRRKRFACLDTALCVARHVSMQAVGLC
jgi:PEP-CTERM motif